MSLSTYFRTGFYPLSFVCDDKDLLDRVQTNSRSLSVVCGFIAGFTFVVISTDIQFSVPLTGASISREEIFYILTGLSFLLALFGCLFGAMLDGLVNLGGKEHIKTFVRQWSFTLGFPLYMMVVSVLLLLAAAFFAVAGRFPALRSWMPLYVVGGVLVVGVAVIFFCMLHVIYKQIDARVALAQIAPSRAGPLAAATSGVLEVE